MKLQGLRAKVTPGMSLITVQAFVLCAGQGGGGRMEMSPRGVNKRWNLDRKLRGGYYRSLQALAGPGVTSAADRVCGTSAGFC